MAVSLKKAVLWRKEIKNQSGTLADSLKPLVKAGVNLQTVMGYVYPDDRKKAAVEIYPVAGSKAEKAAKSGGFKKAQLACLLIEGDDKVGLCQKMAESIADAGINMNFVVIQVVGKKYTGWIGFNSESDANRAAAIVKSVNSGSGKKSKLTPAKIKKAAKQAGAKIIKLASLKKKRGTKKKTSSRAAMRKTPNKRRTVGKKSTKRSAK